MSEKEGFNYRGYMRRYITEKIIYKRVNFSRGNAEDQKLLDWIAMQPEGISPYIKRLIREDMERHKNSP